MKDYKKLTYILIIFFLVGCKTPEKETTKNENNIEIIVSCGEDSNLQNHLKD